MTMAMDVDAMLAPTSRCRCDVDVERPIALSIYPHHRSLLRYYEEKTPGSPLQGRRSSGGSNRGQYVRQLDVHGQTDVE